MTSLVKIDMTFKGTAPLLMHSERLVNSFDPITRKIKEYTGKRKKTEEDELAIQRLEWEGGLYWNESIGPFIPGANVKRCIQEAAKTEKMGKNVLRGITPLDAEIPLIYRGPRDIQGLWDSNKFFDIRSVGVNGRKILRSRPRFDEWAIETSMYVNTDIINLEDFKRWAEYAGAMEGLGDYRPTFGRFEAHVKL